MTVQEHKYHKVKNSISTMAFVQLEINRNDFNQIQIIDKTEQIPFRSQGYIESGNPLWIQSAIKALESVIEFKSLEQGYDIEIKTLCGRELIETNNASIGVACMLAFWEYLNEQVSEVQKDQIDQFVQNNWNDDVEHIPDFKSLEQYFS